MPKKFLITFFVGITVGTVSFAFAEWTPPTATPPNDNTPAPLNVGILPQNKDGVLTLGGLGVLGSALITSGGGYTLPSTLQLGVNGKVGATAYCDQNGNNCVTSLGGATTAVSSTNNTTSGTQILPGWPNKIRCTDGDNEAYLSIFYKGYPSAGKVSYLVAANTGSQIMAIYNYNDGSFDAIWGQGTVGPTIGAAMESCKKNISQIPGI